MTGAGRGFLRSHRTLVALGLLLQVALGVVLARSWLASHNTLEHHGLWVSSKTEVARPLMGAVSFVTTRQALAGGHLDLAAWHGFQEIVLSRDVEPRSLGLRLFLARNGYVSVLFDRVAGEGEAGIVLSASRGFPSTFFEADGSGRFVRRRSLPRRLLPTGRWVAVDLRFAAAGATLTLDGEEVGTYRPSEWRVPQRIGFRGGHRSAFLDDVELATADGVLRDSFDAPRHALAVTLAVPAALVAVNALLFLALARRRRGDAVELGLTLVAADLGLLLAAGALLAFVHWSAGRYAAVDGELQAEEDAERHRRIEEIVAETREGHAHRPAPGTYRVLLVGSSQTWGAGARHEEDTIARRLEAKLDAWSPDGTDFEVIAGAVPGTRAADLEPLLEREWLPLGPRLVAVNLSSNDSDYRRFVGPLEVMVERIVAAGARPVLVLEANAAEATGRGLEQRHGAMREIAARHAATVIDLHRALRPYERQGFLWWDKVHLTSFGQEVAAGILFDGLTPLIEDDLEAASPASAHQPGLRVGGVPTEPEGALGGQARQAAPVG